MIFNNDYEVQKIAISDNKDAFSSPDVVKNILKKVFRKDLEKYGLNIELEQLYNKVDFWNYVSKHKEEITFINFEFIKPNLANISKSLPEVFKSFAERTNSHESHIPIKALEKGILENINKRNEDINGLIASKIQDIIIKIPEFDFSTTIKEMKTSLLEQIVLIGLSILTLLIIDSSNSCFIHYNELKKSNIYYPTFKTQNNFHQLCHQNKTNIMSKTKLTINSNGSVKVEGDFEIVDAQGNAYGLQGRTVLGICRCGHSANKPFCDGAHRNHFEHEAKAFDLPPIKPRQ